MPLLTLTLVLFLIMDPLGNIKSFIKFLEGLKPKRQKQIIIREMLIALGLILLFNFIGEYIFNSLKLAEPVVYLSSGVILFLTALQILFPKEEPSDSSSPKTEPFLVPLAIPMIAGPSLLATVMLYAHTETSQVVMLSAIFISWIASITILLFSKSIFRLIGANGLTACEKLMGMVLILISVERFMEGIIVFLNKPLPV